MGMITDLLDSFASDTTLGKRERRLIDNIMFQYNNLSQAQKHLEQILQTKKISANDLKKDREAIDKGTLKLVENIKTLMQKETFEVDKDVREPFDILKDLIPIIEQYFAYAQKEKTINRASLEKIKTLLQEINVAYNKTIDHIYSMIEVIATVYGSEITTPGKSYASFNVNQFLSIGVQLEKQKIQLSKDIRSVTKKITELKKELNKAMNAYFKERKQSVKYKITSLYEEQKQELEQALALLNEKELQIPLTPSTQNKIKTNINTALAKEQQILNEMFTLNIPSKLNEMLSLQQNPEKKQTQKIIDQLKFYKTKAGFYPIEFWLGEKRALAFLALNDVKNIANLKALLEEGLLHKEYGMLTERINATEQLITDGYLNSQHEEFTSFLEHYIKSFEEVEQLIINRTDLTQKVLTLLGGILANINREIRVIQIRTDATIQALEQDEAALEKQGQNRARIAAETHALERTRREEAAISAQEQAAITTAEKEGVSRLLTIEDVTRQRKTRSTFWTQRLFQKAAMILLPIMAAGALGLSATSTAEAISGDEITATQEYNIAQRQKAEEKKIKEEQQKQKVESKHNDLDSLKSKLDDNKSPVEVLSSLTPEEMNALYNQNKLSLSWTLKSFSITRLGELSNEAERIYKKINSNKEITQTETNFLKNYYYLLAIGGKLKGAEIASELLVHYLEGTGKDLEIDSNIYQESEAVKKAQEEMTKFILKGQQTGKLSSTGILQSDKVFTSVKSFPGGYASNGGTAAGIKSDKKIYLIAEQDNAPLKNANNRFILTAKYKVTGNKVFIEWSVDDDYSFEDSNDKTVIPLPIGEGEIVIRDRLSFFLTKYGAKNFNHHASWNAAYNTGDLT